MPFHNNSTLCISCDILVNLYHHPITSKAPPQVDASSWRSGNGGGPKPPSEKTRRGGDGSIFRYPDGTFLMGKSMGKPWEKGDLYGKPPFLVGKSTISMAIFYVANC